MLFLESWYIGLFREGELSIKRIKSHLVDYYAIGCPWILLGHLRYMKYNLYTSLIPILFIFLFLSIKFLLPIREKKLLVQKIIGNY